MGGLSGAAARTGNLNKQVKDNIIIIEMMVGEIPTPTTKEARNM